MYIYIYIDIYRYRYRYRYIHIYRVMQDPAARMEKHMENTIGKNMDTGNLGE